MKPHVSPIVLLASSTVSAFLTMHDPLVQAVTIYETGTQTTPIVLMNEPGNHTMNSLDDSNQTKEDNSSPSPNAEQPGQGDAKQHHNDGNHSDSNDDDNDNDDDGDHDDNDDDDDEEDDDD